ncbi:MAG TPA: hypothetical protein VG929_03750 [Actinomycetota bacterium]|nr:hypothetical protein [Actinomycetota bacterium]
MRRSISLLTLLLVASGLLAPSVGAQSERAPGEPCGRTTIDATLRINPQTGVLECAPGEPVRVRTELAQPQPDRARTRDALTSFFAIADVQLADEESPARGEGSDPCYPSPGISSSAFRPHETMVPHLMNAHVRAANEIAAAGSPNLGDHFDFLVGLGDLADNQQYNEIRWIIDILDGGKLVNPDTGNDPVLGGEGYDGPQARDPRGGGGRTPQQASPDLPADGVLELANEPFWATGFRHGNDDAAERLPWYSLPGNHDVKVQGTLPDEASGRDHNELKAWRAIYRSYYIGNAKVVLQDLPPEYKQELCGAIKEGKADRVARLLEEWSKDPVLVASATSRKVVPADQARMALYRSDQIKTAGDEEACLAVATPARPIAQHACRSSWIEEHRITDGVPVGHGYGENDGDESPRCRDNQGKLLERACYSFTSGLFHYIALDSNPPEGMEKGNIDPRQFEWLERELIANSSTYYDADGKKVHNRAGTDHMIVVFAHHPTEESMVNQAPTSPGKTGADLRKLLLRFPNVILNANGHTHQNRIWARSNETLGTGYWEVNTSAIADVPTQSRTIEIANNNDGTLSIFATVFDAWVAPNAAEVEWHGHDHSHETEHGAERDINEDWLASWGREVMLHDPQQDLTKKAGTENDRNVELLLKTPEWLRTATELTYTGETSEQVGKTLDASAVLTTASGRPLSGMTVTFTYGPDTHTATTDASGIAAASFQLTGPPRGGSLSIGFAGTDAYQPSNITVPVTVYASPRRQASAASPGGVAVI